MIIASQLNIINQALQNGEEANKLGVNRGSDGLHIFQKVDTKTSQGMESDKIIYFRIYNFINDNRDKLSVSDLAHVRFSCEHGINQIKKNTSGFKAFFRYLFNSKEKAEKLQRKQYLETVKDFANSIIRKKTKEAE